MPKFSESEKAIIKDKLLYEGERLFTQHGIKKVSVDDLVKAAGIAKGSFYAFYTNKEHLYMDILANLQKKLWENIDGFLHANHGLPPKELTKQLFLYFFKDIQQHPILMQQNAETTDYLFRKLPKEVLEAHTHDDTQELAKLLAHGITFKCGLEVAAKTLQALAITFFSLQHENGPGNDTVIEILLNGVINELVCDSHD